MRLREASIQGKSIVAAIAALLLAGSAASAAAPARQAFEPNRGQADPAFSFVTRGDGYRLLLGPTKSVLRLSSPATDSLRLVFLGAGAPRIEGTEPLPGRVHYLVGSEPGRWLADVPTFAAVRYAQLFPGVDVTVRGDDRELEYEFLVAPGASPDAIRLGAESAKSLELDAGSGDLFFRMAGGAAFGARLRAGQEGDGGARSVDARFGLGPRGEIGFRLSGYDAEKPLVVSLRLRRSGSVRAASEDPARVAIGADGTVWVAGRVAVGAGEEGDAFVSRLSADRTTTLSTTYLGGDGDDVPLALAIDADGSAILTGVTRSSDFPLAHAVQRELRGGSDAFVSRLSPDGSTLVFSTYLGGEGDDEGRAVVADDAGAIWVAGRTEGAGFPVTSAALQREAGGGSDAFVARLAPDGGDLVYASYLGGRDDDEANAIGIDRDGRPHLAGTTRSADFPTERPLQGAPGGSAGRDAFVVTLRRDASGLAWATFLGGSADDDATGLVVDRAGDTLVTGRTSSGDFPVTPDAIQQRLNGTGDLDHSDAFLAVLDPDGRSLAHATFLGGSLDDEGRGIALDSRGNAWIAGTTSSPEFPGAEAKSARRDAFLAEIGRDGRALARSVLLGGEDDDAGRAVAVTGAGEAVLAGVARSVEVGAALPVQPAFAGGLVVLAGFAAQAAGCPGTINFDNTAGTGLWQTATNWDLDRLPVGTDDVCIGGFAVTLSSGTPTVNSLFVGSTGSLAVTAGTLSLTTASQIDGAFTLGGSGTLGGAGMLTVNGATTCTAGTMTGAGRTRTNGGLSISTSGLTLAGGRILENPAGSTATMTANVGFNFGTSGSVENAGTWDVQNDADFTELGGVGTRTVTNTGTFRKSTGAASTVFGAFTTFANTSPGSVEVQSGTLALPAGTHTGSFSVSSGAVLQLTNTTAFNSPASISGAGGVMVTAAQSDFNTGTSYAPGGATTVSAGTLSFNAGSTATPGSLVLSGSGTLGGAALVNVTGATTCTGGTMTGTGRTRTSGGLSITTSGLALTGGRILENPAGSTATMTANLGFNFGSSASVENAGTWDVQSDADFTELGGTGTRTVTNTGTFRKSTGAAATVFGASTTFSNTSPGSVEVQSGTLALPAGTHTGSFSISAGATLQLTGTAAFNSPAGVTGAGAVSVTAGTSDFNTGTSYAPGGATTVGGGTLSFNTGSTPTFTSPTTVSAGTLNFSTAPVNLAGLLLSGTLGGTGQVTVAGATTWTGGTMTGTGRTKTSGGLSIATGIVTLAGGRALENPSGSTATMASSVSFAFGASGSVENAGTWDVQNDADFAELGGGGTRTVTNTGTFRKSTGAASTVFGLGTTFANTSPGSVEVQSGTLALPAGTHTGSFSISSGAVLQLTNTTVFNSPASVTGAGGVSVTAGQTDFNTGTSYAPAGATTIAGTLNFNAGSTATLGSLALSGTLGGAGLVTVTGPTTWTGGTMTGTGRTKTGGGLTIATNAVTLAGGRVLENTAGSTATMAASLTFSFGASESIENGGTWDLENDADFADGGGVGTRTISNTGTLEKSSGSGTSTVPLAFTSSGSVLSLAGTLDFRAGFTQTAGQTTLSGGSITSTATMSLQGGVLQGTGTLGASVTSSGQVAPGLSTGILDETGNYVQTLAGSLSIELGGTTPGTQHDRLAVTGTAALAGTLTATLVNGFVPADGDAFTILTSASRTGTFSIVQLPPLAPLWFWTTTYGATSVIITAHLDTDSDGTPDPLDCAPLDPGAFAPPGEIAGDAFGADKQTYSWTSAVPTSGSATVHDVMRGALRQFPVGSGVSETCLDPGEPSAAAVDGTTPAAGAGFYYLVRGRNVCATGTYGHATSGAERITTTCP